MHSIQVRPDAPGWALPPPTWTRAAVVTRVEGIAHPAVGEACRVTARRFGPAARELACRWRVQCGEVVLYGEDLAGWAPCAQADWPAGTRVLDAQTAADDGDPALAVDEAGGTLTVRDDAQGEHGAFAVEARLAPGP
jgi:hypothetical protein